MKRLLLVFPVLLGLLVCCVAAWFVFVSAPPAPDEPRWVHIYPGTTLNAVADSLHAQDLLRPRLAFTLPAKATGWGSQIKAGCYEFEERAPAYRILHRLRAGEQTTVRMTIPAGSRPEFVARSAARHMFFQPEDFLEALKDSMLATSLGLDTRRLFSYMLPDTYHFYCTADARSVVSRIKQEMDALFASGLGKLGAQHGLDKDEVISLAGIVEWETRVDEEKARVAGVYLNRLRKRWPLQADPTIQYALIELEGGKRRLYYTDYKLRHPYNTYLYRGFPPGPITNPGYASLKAAADPESHSYMFFVASPEGGHAFNVTLRGHNRDAARLRVYLRGRNRAD